MNSWRDAAVRLRAEFARNGRLRAGVWVLLGLASISLLTLQRERLDEANFAYATEYRQLAATTNALSRRDWAERLAAERELNERLVARFWRADTEGLAQAQLQQAMRELSEGLELRNPRIRSGVSQYVPGIPGVCRVQVQMSSEYPPGGELRLVHAIATHPKKLVADRLDMGRDRFRIMVLLSAHFVGLEGGSCGTEDGNA